MVAVAADHGDKVLLGPLLEEFGIAVRLLRIGPCVRELIHYEEAHPVAKGKQFARRGIVGGTDGVAAHILQHVEAAHPGRFVPGRAETAGIVVEADSLEEGLLAVEIEAVGFELRAADAEIDLPVVYKSVLALDGRDGNDMEGILIGAVGRPQFRLLDEDLPADDLPVFQL